MEMTLQPSGGMIPIAFNLKKSKNKGDARAFQPSTLNLGEIIENITRTGSADEYGNLFAGGQRFDVFDYTEET